MKHDFLFARRRSVALIFLLALAGANLFSASPSLAQSGNADVRYVSDEFEITMRRGPSTDNAIVRMLPSGTPLRVLSSDSATGYTQVQLTTSDTQGYVLTRYLMREQDARSQLASLQQRIEELRGQSGDRGRELDDLRQASAAAAARISALESDNARLETELGALQRKAANVINIDRENTTLRRTLTDAEIQVQALTEENQQLSSRQLIVWFVVGAAVLVLGIILGLVLPTLRRRKRGGYGGGDLL
ncbi:MAG: TIGR04211 family SH3 domain-containing protein [Pseudomonadota bacterium]